MGVRGRVLVLVVYAALLIWLIAPAYESLASSNHWSGSALALCTATMLIPAVMLVLSVTSRFHSLAWSVFWTWSLIFLGLAPAYQLSTGLLPWGSVPQPELVSATHWVIIAGYLAAIAGFVLTATGTRSLKAQIPLKADLSPVRRVLTTILVSYILIAAVFVAAMGSALIEGRAAFSARLVALPASLGMGTVYFLSTAGAIVLPATAIVLRRRGVAIRPSLIVACTVAAFIVTNPLIGSRFLTGSFAVALVAALVARPVRRWMPAGVIVLFVTIFPTLDLLRGDGTGSTQVQATDPSTTLTSFDYDAFEMLYRAVSLNGQIAYGLPNRTDLTVAPFLRWIPFVSSRVQGDATGPVVARSTGMGYTNVSMPLWGEAFYLGSWIALIVVFAALGAVLALTRRTRGLASELLEIPIAALLFIVLRGSLYEVLGYLMFAILVATGLAYTATRKGTEHPDSRRARIRRAADTTGAQAQHARGRPGVGGVSPP